MAVGDIDAKKNVFPNIPVELLQGDNLVIQGQYWYAFQLHRGFAAEFSGFPEHLYAVPIQLGP